MVNLKHLPHLRFSNLWRSLGCDTWQFKTAETITYIGSMGETRSGKMTSEIRWSHGSLTNKKEVSEDTRYQGGGIIHGWKKSPLIK